MLAMRLGDGQYEPDLPVSARIRADIGPDGIPRTLEGRIQIDKGFIADADEPLNRNAIDRAEFNLEWDATRQILGVPFQIVSGGNRFTFFAQLDAPRSPAAFGMNHGWDRRARHRGRDRAARHQPSAAAHAHRSRQAARRCRAGSWAMRRSGSRSPAVSTLPTAIRASPSGLPATECQLRRLSGWPALLARMCAPGSRAYSRRHHRTAGDRHQRADVHVQAERAAGSDDGLAIEIAGNGAEIRPVYGLPSIRDADINVRVSGRTAVIGLGRGNVDLSPGRKLAITNGSFEVADTHLNAPPAKIRFRLDGPVPAAAELLALERLRDFSGAPLDPATSRGTLSAQVQLGMPLRPDLPAGATQYVINMDLSNFAAEKLVIGQKVEATTLKVSANNQGYYIRGDVKIGGVPAALDYRKPRGDADAEVRIQATLDDAARGKLGLSLGAYLSGPVPIKINGRVPAVEGDIRFAVEADLTQARVIDCFPAGSSRRPVRRSLRRHLRPARDVPLRHRARRSAALLPRRARAGARGPGREFRRHVQVAHRG
jgi:hypothetical protein